MFHEAFQETQEFVLLCFSWFHFWKIKVYISQIFSETLNQRLECILCFTARLRDCSVFLKIIYASLLNWQKSENRKDSLNFSSCYFSCNPYFRFLLLIENLTLKTTDWFFELIMPMKVTEHFLTVRPCGNFLSHLFPWPFCTTCSFRPEVHNLFLSLSLFFWRGGGGSHLSCACCLPFPFSSLVHLPGFSGITCQINLLHPNPHFRICFCGNLG